MPTRSPESAAGVVKSVGILQLKLVLDTLRDLVISPAALVAALADLLLLKWRRPEFLHLVLRVGAFSDHWIDLWSEDAESDTPRENVDVLLDRLEQVVRDPKAGARKARILRRWAERQVAQARQQTTTQPTATKAPATSDNDSPDQK